MEGEAEFVLVETGLDLLTKTRIIVAKTAYKVGVGLMKPETEESRVRGRQK